jgi:ferredoxin
MCDGLGACIGQCPQGAITLEKREAELYDETIFMEAHGSAGPSYQPEHGVGCPGSRTMTIDRPAPKIAAGIVPALDAVSLQSELRQWPVQMHLINPQAPYYRNADVVIAADCVAFAMGDFHHRYLKGKSLAIACPKLDSSMEVYVNKITAMIDHANINTITVMIMQVPCCGGLLQIVKTAASAARRKVPIKLIVAALDGSVMREEWV